MDASNKEQKRLKEFRDCLAGFAMDRGHSSPGLIHEEAMGEALEFQARTKPNEDPPQVDTPSLAA